MENINLTKKVNKKWYQHKGIMANVILAITAAILIWVYWIKTTPEREAQLYTNHVYQELLVSFKPGTDINHVISLSKEVSGVFEGYDTTLNFATIYIPDKSKLEQATQTLQKQPDVINVSRNGFLHAD